MANRRMFSKSIVDTDKFMDMGTGAQLLYYNLGIQADDDGFVSAPKKIMRACRASDGDMKELIREGYVLYFENVIAITHWRVNNFLRNDRYTPSSCRERSTVCVLPSGEYGYAAEHPDCPKLPSSKSLSSSKKAKNEEKKVSKAVTVSDTAGIPDGIPVGIPSGIPTVYPGKDRLELELELGKERKEKEEIDAFAHEEVAATSEKTEKRKRFTPPCISEIEDYCKEKGYTLVDAEYFWNYYENLDWKIKGTKMKNWRLAVANWDKRQKGYQMGYKKDNGETPFMARDSSEDDGGWWS